MSVSPQPPLEALGSLDPPTPSIHNDLFAHHGRQIIAHFINKSLRDRSESIAPEPLERILVRCGSIQPAPPSEPVGILGAGASGLYTALILLDLGIPFKIIEARERPGGRLFTYKFPDKTGEPYNYYDVGAMRFPETISMRRVFHLFNYEPLNQGDLQLRKKLKPFLFSHPKALMSYNGETYKRSDVQLASFQPEAVIQDLNPEPYITAGYQRIMADVVEPFAKRLYEDLQNNTNIGWEYLRTFDGYSARSYMQVLYRPSRSLGLPDRALSVDVVNWIETFDACRGAYDRGLCDILLEKVLWGWNPSPDAVETKWWCIDGGVYQIADTMYRYLKRKSPTAFAFEKRVTGIKTVKDANGTVVAIGVATDDRKVERFSHVVSSIPLPVMRTIDLTGASLTPMQSNALRQVTYTPSVKVGMQFRSAWWTTATNRAGRTLAIVGGQTYSDSPLGKVVYPSCGNVEAGETTTLIASYTLWDDAEPLQALVTNAELRGVLEDVVLRELARIHDLDIDILRGQLIDMHAWSWSHDPCTMGAFSFFGPGQFMSVYQSLTRPAGGGRLHFAGEALSTRQPWVEGALDSAWRAVFALLLTEPAWKRLLGRFFQRWGYNAEWFAAVPPERHGGESTGSPVLELPDKKGPVVGVPYGQWHPPREGEEPDVDELLDRSLLPRHIALALKDEESFEVR